MQGVTRKSVVYIDSHDNLHFIRKVSNIYDEYPEAFIHAIRDNKRMVPNILNGSNSSLQLSASASFTHEGNSEQPTMIPDSVIAALTSIQHKQLRRVQEKVSHDLDEILGNVVKTIDVFYSDQCLRNFNKKNSQENDEETRVKIQKLLEGDIEDERLYEEPNMSNKSGELILNIVNNLSETCADRLVILSELSDWLHKYPADSFPGQDPLQDEVYDVYDEGKLMLNECHVAKNIRRLSSISEEMGLTEKRRETKGEIRKKLVEERINRLKSKNVISKVFDADSLAEPKHWRIAYNTISQVLEEATTTSANPRSKQMFGNANKQFRLMIELADKRQEEKAKMDTQLSSMTGKLNNQKKEMKSLRKKKQSLESQLEKIQEDIVELKREVKIRDELLKEKTEESNGSTDVNDEEVLKTEENAKQDDLPQQQQKQPKPSQQKTQHRENEQATAVKTPSNKKEMPTSDCESSKRKDASKEEEETRGNWKEELEEMRRIQEEAEDVIKHLKMKQAAENANFEQEKNKLEEEIEIHKLRIENAKKELEAEREERERVRNEMLEVKEKLSYEIKSKEEIISTQDKKIQEVAQEMTLSLIRAGLQANASTHNIGRGTATEKLLESKQMLAKLHLQYEYEMQKLRTYAKRETERHNAEIRRLEYEYSNKLDGIYKETSVIFRAVNRFKECLAVLFDRENLAEAAQGIRNLANLFEDESSTNPQVKLLKMAGEVTELVVQMECKMSQALMNKRMELKDHSHARNLLSKDLEAREELLKKAKELGSLQAEKLKHAREALSSQETELLKMKNSETDKYLDLMERNKELSRQNQILNKELTYLHREMQDETSFKQNQRQANEEMKRKIEEQSSIIASLRSENTRILKEQKLTLKTKDMMKNVKLLNHALAERKIPNEKHTMAMTIIEETMDATDARLACFVKKYLVHKNWKKICEALKEHHRKSKRPEKIEIYLKNLEHQVIEKNKKLVEKKAEMLQKKTAMYLCFQEMCNKLNNEDDVHLIQPQVEKVQENISQAEETKAMEQKQQDVLKNIFHARPAHRQYFGSFNDSIKGYKFFVPKASHMWQFPGKETSQASIVTPKILDIDVRKARETCQRVLTSKGEANKGWRISWCRREKMQESFLTLPPIATIYPEK